MQGDELQTRCIRRWVTLLERGARISARRILHATGLLAIGHDTTVRVFGLAMQVRSGCAWRRVTVTVAQSKGGQKDRPWSKPRSAACLCVALWRWRLAFWLVAGGGHVGEFRSSVRQGQGP